MGSNGLGKDTKFLLLKAVSRHGTDPILRVGLDFLEMEIAEIGGKPSNCHDRHVPSGYPRIFHGRFHHNPRSIVLTMSADLKSDALKGVATMIGRSRQQNKKPPESHDRQGLYPVLQRPAIQVLQS